MRIVGSVLFCHFLSAFSVLGMPLFLPRMLDAFGNHTPAYLVGILYALPSICTALAAPLWGRFADQYGKRLSLLRAQLGLMAGFLIAGFADSISVFAAGLVIQGLCGGTLAASNAYLAAQQQGSALANSLNLTQVSARLALIIGPIVLGLFTQLSDPLLLYRFLAILPALAICLTLLLPVDKPLSKALKKTTNSYSDWKIKQLITLQFLFCFSMVVTFPYFLPYAANIGVSNDSWVGLLYSLPHVLYILLILPLGKMTWPATNKTVSGLLIVALSGLVQYLAISEMVLMIGRVLFGVGMVLAYCGLHQLLSANVSGNNSGAIFGKIDASGKWAGFVAGIVAGAFVGFFDYRFTFALSMASAVLGAGLLLVVNKRMFGNEDSICT